MDLLDHVRAGEVEHLGDVLVPHPVALEVERAGLEIGAHRAVEDDDALAGEVEKRRFIQNDTCSNKTRAAKPTSGHPSVHPDGLLDPASSVKTLSLSAGPRTGSAEEKQGRTTPATLDLTTGEAFLQLQRLSHLTSLLFHPRVAHRRKCWGTRVSPRKSAMGGVCEDPNRRISDVVGILNDRGVDVTLLDPSDRFFIGIKPHDLICPSLLACSSPLARRAPGKEADNAADVGVGTHRLRRRGRSARWGS